VERLTEAILAAEQLDAGIVQEIGVSRFDPERHFRVLSVTHAS
jgi:hypothetical protein